MKTSIAIYLRGFARRIWVRLGDVMLEVWPRPPEERRELRAARERERFWAEFRAGEREAESNSES